MATIFTVECPECRERFPCHAELWNAGYDLLCPFCGHTFPQDDSPLIEGADGSTTKKTDTSAAESM